MDEEKCGNCYFSRPNNEVSVICRRWPPMVTKVEFNEATGQRVFAHNPLPSSEWWCGEWRDKSMAEGKSPPTIRNARLTRRHQ